MENFIKQYASEKINQFNLRKLALEEEIKKIKEQIEYINQEIQIIENTKQLMIKSITNE